MAKCKTEGCEKEAAAGSEYCPACGCENDKKNKNTIKAVLGAVVVVLMAALPFLHSDSK